jgi:putative acetyltransferase
MEIRNERAADAAAIAGVVTAAFGRPEEARLVERLRRDGDVEISLVGVEGDLVVGHVLLSRLRAPFAALGLAPVSVAPDLQRRGVGGALIRAALARAAAEGWGGVFVLGDPDYYGRFGFDAGAARGFASPYAGRHFMALALDGALPATSGVVAYPTAFADAD